MAKIKPSFTLTQSVELEVKLDGLTHENIYLLHVGEVTLNTCLHKVYMPIFRPGIIYVIYN